MKFGKRQGLSGREMRRLGEKSQREAAKRQQAFEQMTEWKRLSPEEQIRKRAEKEALDRIQRNGITVDDLKRNYDDGFKAGYKEGCEITFETFFAATCLALNELHGFGGKRCRAVLNLIHDKVYYCISRQEIMQEVMDKMGLKIDFREDAGEVVQEKGA